MKLNYGFFVIKVKKNNPPELTGRLSSNLDRFNCCN